MKNDISSTYSTSPRQADEKGIRDAGVGKSQKDKGPTAARRPERSKSDGHSHAVPKIKHKTSSDKLSVSVVDSSVPQEFKTNPTLARDYEKEEKDRLKLFRGKSDRKRKKSSLSMIFPETADQLNLTVPSAETPNNEPSPPISPRHNKPSVTFDQSKRAQEISLEKEEAKRKLIERLQSQIIQKNREASFGHDSANDKFWSTSPEPLLSSNTTEVARASSSSLGGVAKARLGVRKFSTNQLDERKKLTEKIMKTYTHADPGHLGNFDTDDEEDSESHQNNESSRNNNNSTNASELNVENNAQKQGEKELQLKLQLEKQIKADLDKKLELERKAAEEKLTVESITTERAKLLEKIALERSLAEDRKRAIVKVDSLLDVSKNQQREVHEQLALERELAQKRKKALKNYQLDDKAVSFDKFSKGNRNSSPSPLIIPRSGTPVVDSNDRRKIPSSERIDTSGRDCASPRSRGVKDYRLDEHAQTDRGSSKRNLNPSSAELSPRKPTSPRRTIDEASLALLSLNPENVEATTRNRTLGVPTYKRSVLVDSTERREKRTKTLGSPEIGGPGSKEFIQDMRAARQSVASKKLHKRHSAKDLIPRGDRKLVASEEKSVVISSIEIQVTTPVSDGPKSPRPFAEKSRTERLALAKVTLERAINEFQLKLREIIDDINLSFTISTTQASIVNLLRAIKNEILSSPHIHFPKDIAKTQTPTAKSSQQRKIQEIQIELYVLARLLNEIEIQIVTNTSETSLQNIVDTILKLKPAIQEVSTIFYSI